eukprot:Plantae.Rhodophyta-Purpureofilum_apyrenoidigerum.ctg49688.p1 GENE.Plantae.Rhodophyta-Purpureofilum_apyrenoidigerum.ctg49688~~Plantae.Rhodophyta-Purpureofilum_apyrenoidigerum.ctg49688.p1  ORF type:complete len:276 (-),score=65.40 Plantae.Rhodophyta-Purpureofilum_apyrenoidigerum.ctg49688:57-839(-)
MKEHLKDSSEGSGGDELLRSAGSIVKNVLSDRKRASERRRREEIHASFKDLERLLTETRGEEVIKGRKWDKEKIVNGASEHIRHQETRITTIHGELEQMGKELDELRSEKVELRADKTYLKEELVKLREENSRLRNDNITLWQAIRNKDWHAQPQPVLRAPEPVAMYQLAPGDDPELDPSPDVPPMMQDSDDRNLTLPLPSVELPEESAYIPDMHIRGAQASPEQQQRHQQPQQGNPDDAYPASWGNPNFGSSSVENMNF